MKVEPKRNQVDNLLPPANSTRSSTVEETETHQRVTLSIRNDSVREDDRSVEVILATESRVLVRDPSSGRIMEEILLMSGVEIIEQVPLLNDHRTFDLDYEFGSVREFRVVAKKLH